MNSKTKKIVMIALMAALTCIATMVIRIPSPLKGYVNLGDCIVLAAGWMLPPAYGFLAAGLGSALADLFSGYLIYVPATFLIKGLMALVAFFGFRRCGDRVKKLFARIVSGIAAELTMILGYFVFEGLLYGFAPSLVNIPANAVQGLAGLCIGTVLIGVFEKNGIRF